MISPFLYSQCSRRTLLDASSMTRTLLKQSRKYNLGRQYQPIQPLNRIIQPTDTWQWHRKLSVMDVPKPSIATFSSLLSSDETERTKTRTHSRLASHITNLSSQQSGMAHVLANFVHRYPAHNPHVNQQRYFNSTIHNRKEDQNASTAASTTQPHQQLELPPQQLSSKTPPKTRPPQLLLDIQVPQFGLDADKAVRSLQNARKERARAKTAANVRRALYGNLIICASKLGAWLSSGSSCMMSEFVYVHHRSRYSCDPLQLRCLRCVLFLPCF
jgi:hypothetical protein